MPAPQRKHVEYGECGMVGAKHDPTRMDLLISEHEHLGMGV